MREKKLKEISLVEKRKELEKKQNEHIKNQIKAQDVLKKADKERELNNQLYGKRLTNEEIKNLFDNKPEGWKEALNNRFGVSPQDKSFS